MCVPNRIEPIRIEPRRVESNSRSRSYAHVRRHMSMRRLAELRASCRSATPGAGLVALGNAAAAHPARQRGQVAPCTGTYRTLPRRRAPIGARGPLGRRGRHLSDVLTWDRRRRGRGGGPRGVWCVGIGRGLVRAEEQPKDVFESPGEVDPRSTPSRPQIEPRSTPRPPRIPRRQIVLDRPLTDLRSAPKIDLGCTADRPWSPPDRPMLTSARTRRQSKIRRVSTCSASPFN